MIDRCPNCGTATDHYLEYCQHCQYVPPHGAD